MFVARRRKWLYLASDSASGVEGATKEPSRIGWLERSLKASDEVAQRDADGVAELAQFHDVQSSLASLALRYPRLSLAKSLCEIHLCQTGLLARFSQMTQNHLIFRCES